MVARGGRTVQPPPLLQLREGGRESRTFTHSFSFLFSCFVLPFCCYCCSILFLHAIVTLYPCSNLLVSPPSSPSSPSSWFALLIKKSHLGRCNTHSHIVAILRSHPLVNRVALGDHTSPWPITQQKMMAARGERVVLSPPLITRTPSSLSQTQPHEVGESCSISVQMLVYQTRPSLTLKKSERGSSRCY